MRKARHVTYLHTYLFNHLVLNWNVCHIFIPGLVIFVIFVTFHAIILKWKIFSYLEIENQFY